MLRPIRVTNLRYLLNATSDFDTLCARYSTNCFIRTRADFVSDWLDRQSRKYLKKINELAFFFWDCLKYTYGPELLQFIRKSKCTFKIPQTSFQSDNRRKVTISYKYILYMHTHPHIELQPILLITGQYMEELNLQSKAYPHHLD